MKQDIKQILIDYADTLRESAQKFLGVNMINRKFKKFVFECAGNDAGIVMPGAVPGFSSYRVFYRETGHIYDYANPDWEGTETSCTLYNLKADVAYFFVAT